MSIIERTLKETIILDPVSLEHLVMFPLAGPARQEPGYITLDEAMDRGVVEATEVSEGGRVPEVRFINRGDVPVFIMDGEEIVGAKQNRVANLSMLIDARSEVVIPVSCVEAGRWSFESRSFRPAEHLMFTAARARKAARVTRAMLETGTRLSDQHEIWEDIRCRAQAMDALGETEAMDEIYERHRASINDYVRAMKTVDGQTGALFFIGSSLVSLDQFDCESTLRAMLPKVVRANALDAIAAARHGQEPPAPAKEQARAFLDEAAGAPAQSHPAVGLGQDLRISSEDLSGGALEWDGWLVHLSAFRLSLQRNPWLEHGRRAQVVRPWNRMPRVLTD